MKKYTEALEFASKALQSAPDEDNKQGILIMIEKLNAGKDIN
jgi:hypothetical protein